MLCFLSFVVLISEMELATFKITILPLRGKMFNLSRKIVENSDDAEDIVQEAFLKLWNMRGRLDEYDNVEALVMMIVRNLTLDRLRTRRPQGDEPDNLLLDSGTMNPAEQLEQQDAVACIRHLIAGLPTLQQTIIRMKDVEGYEIAEIAGITGAQPEAIRVNLSRARKKIREQYLMLNGQR